MYERSQEPRFIIAPPIGIMDCDYTKEEVYRMLGQHERTSVKLTVSEKYKEIFSTIKKYITDENNEIKDDNLKQELEILDLLMK